jgi:hypothetical protein
MLRQAVASSDLKSVGYDQEKQVLEIEFHSGGIYQYSNVPVFVYRSLMKASSPEHYYNTQIKKAYSAEKIE